MYIEERDWLNTPIEYEIVDGHCSYCGHEGKYFDPELTGALPNEDGTYGDGFWVCPLCEDYNLQIEQGTLEG